MHEQPHYETGEGAYDETGYQPRKNGHGRILLSSSPEIPAGVPLSGAGQTKTQAMPAAGRVLQAGSLFVRNRRTFSRYGVGCVCSQQRSPAL